MLRDMQKAELTVEEVDKIFGPADGPAQVRRVPHRRHRRPRHLRPRRPELLRHAHPGRGARRRSSCPSSSRRWSQRGMLGDKTGGGFYKKVKGKDGESEILALDLATLDLPAAAEGPLRLARRRQGRRRRAPSASRTVLTGTRQGREVRRAGDAGHAGLREPPHPGDLRRPGQHRPRAALGLRLGPRALRGLGRATACARASSG